MRASTSAQKKRIKLYSGNCVTKIFSPQSDIVVHMYVAINNTGDGRINPGHSVAIRQHVKDDEGVLRVVKQACQHSLQIGAHIFSAHLVWGNKCIKHNSSSI